MNNATDQSAIVLRNRKMNVVFAVTGFGGGLLDRGRH